MSQGATKLDLKVAKSSISKDKPADVKRKECRQGQKNSRIEADEI